MKDSGYEAILYYACNLQLIIQYHWALQESTNAVAYPEISTRVADSPHAQCAGKKLQPSLFY